MRAGDEVARRRRLCEGDAFERAEDGVDGLPGLDMDATFAATRV